MDFVKEMMSVEKIESFKELIKRSRTVDELREFLKG